MNLTESSLRNPAGVAVALAFIVFFGAWSLWKLPVQLFPDIERPRINIQTAWRAASPREVESEVVEPIERVMRGLPGLEEIGAFANPGLAWVELEFALGTDMDRMLLEVISRMNRLDPLPRDATPPRIQLGGGDGAGPALTFFFLQVLPGNAHPISDYIPLAEDVIRPALEAVPGVASVQAINGLGGEEELQILFDPFRAAEQGVAIPDMAALVGTANDVSGGFVDAGRRQYTLRFAGRYQPEELAQLVLAWRDGQPVRLGDVAEVRRARADSREMALQNGNPAISIRIDRETGANVLETLAAVKKVVAELNEGQLAEKQLVMAQSFDASVFIEQAIGLLGGNLALGVILAVGVLWWFLRRAAATLIVAVAIPVSLLATFVALWLAGRTLNVISLAGLAFAVGMTLDAAIVVLENIVRLRERGLGLFEAALAGARQVWGALLASTATTVAIFLPVLFMDDVEGQLFADLALTIAIAVSASLVVAVTLVPLAARLHLREAPEPDRNAASWEWITRNVMRLTDTPRRRAGVIAVLIALPVTLAVVLLPELDYLPPVKRDAVDAFLRFPPGASAAHIREQYVEPIRARLEPYMNGAKEPRLRNYYILTWPNGGTVGVRALDRSRYGELERIVREEVLAGLPDLQSAVAQGNLFGGIGAERTVSMRLQARDRDRLAEAAGVALERLRERFPGINVQANPELEQAEPELRLRPDDRALGEAGWTRAALGSTVRALGDGLWVGEHFDGERRLDVILRAQPWDDPAELVSVPLATAGGGVRPLGELVAIEHTVGPNLLARINGRRTVSLDIFPPDDLSLEALTTALREDVEPAVRKLLPADGNILYGGSANSLTEAVKSLGANFALALVLLFLLMAALFRSARDSALVVLSIPLGTVGGVIALRLLGLLTFQPLDLLTMIGFVILLGLVVNNAILLVEQTRIAERDGLDRGEAVRQALRTRLRPIAMSTLTSICGMLPSVLMPGPGAVIYRGLAAVIVGGLALSTVFTLLLLPCLLRVGEARRSEAAATTTAPRGDVLRLDSAA